MYKKLQKSIWYFQFVIRFFFLKFRFIFHNHSDAKFNDNENIFFVLGKTQRYVKILNLLKSNKKNLVILHPDTIHENLIKNKEFFSIIKAKNEYEFFKLFKKCKKIKHLFVDSGFQAYPYLSEKNNCILHIYDSTIGNKQISNNKNLCYEKTSIENSFGVIHRDLRIKKYYKNILKNKLNYLYIDPFTNSSEKKNNFKKVLVAGWLDKEIFPFKQIIKLCEFGLQVDIFTWKNCEEYLVEEIKYLKTKFSNNFFVKKPLFGNEYLEILKQYDMGICATSNTMKHYEKNYLECAGSSRLSDYISNGMSVLVPDFAKFNKYVCKKSGVFFLNFSELESSNNIHEMILRFKKNVSKKNKIYNDEFFSKKFENYLKIIDQKS